MTRGSGYSARWLVVSGLVLLLSTLLYGCAATAPSASCEEIDLNHEETTNYCVVTGVDSANVFVQLNGVNTSGFFLQSPSKVTFAKGFQGTKTATFIVGVDNSREVFRLEDNVDGAGNYAGGFTWQCDDFSQQHCTIFQP